MGDSKSVHDSIKAYWASSSRREHVADMAHIRGAGRWRDGQLWLKLGEENVSRILDFTGDIGSALEWGPGGGANARALCARGVDVFGVDISDHSLDAASKACKGLSGGFTPVETELESPEAVLSGEIQKFDLIYSTACFQHFPDRAYALRVLRTMHGLLSDGGKIVLQVRYGPSSARESPTYNDTTMLSYTTFDIAEFWTFLRRFKFEPRRIELSERERYAWYFATRA